MRDLAREPEAGLGVLAFDARGAAFEPVWAGGGAVAFTPTSELPAHVAIHAALRRRDSACRAIVHTHPGELLALSHDPRLRDEPRLNALLWSAHPELVVVVPAGVAVVPYAVPGSEAQGEAAGSAMAAHEVALWEKHGAVAVGATFTEAFDLIDTVDAAARLALLCRAAGYEPEGLTPERVAELRRAYPTPSVR
jgi:rhamnulose-1-phosphate aldolase